MTALKWRLLLAPACNGVSDQSYEEGICFYTSDGVKIANYPKQHRANLTTKHQNTSSWLKPMVRIMKNMRSRMVDDGLIKADMHPHTSSKACFITFPATNFIPTMTLVL